MVRRLWVWESAGLRSGGQKGGPRATRGDASVHGFEPGGDVGTFRRRVHDGSGHAAVSGLLQGRVVGIGEPRHNVYNNTWSEKYHGVREEKQKDGAEKFVYDVDKNSEIARNLKGHLMLTTGDMD